MKNKRTVVKVIALILAIAIIAGVAIAIIYNKNVMLADNENKEVEEQTQELELKDNEYMHVELDASGDKVPVPNGFVGSNATGENEIDSGYVIYAGEDEVNDSNVAEAKKTRNQYVWVPVPDPSKFYGTDANGKRWGKNYNFTTGTNSSITFDEVTGTYANNWGESNRVMSLSSSTNYREPDVVVGSGSTGYDMDSRLRTLGLGAETTHEFLMQLEKEFSKMLDSVEKYGGFYIGRYETGNLSQDQVVVQKGNTDINYQTWYTMYKKCKELENSNTAVKTGMIWGNQWDRTLMWLIECNAENPETGKSKEEVISNSSSWGNYSNSTGEAEYGSGTRRSTGYNEAWKANNIYDLAGNVSEWTMEAYGTYYRVYRGGDYISNGTYTASYRVSSYPTYSSIYIRLQGCTLHKVTLSPDGNALATAKPEA